MLERIKDINPSIPGMLVVELLYLIVGEVLIIIIASSPLKFAVGLAAGVVYAVFSTFHMSFRIQVLHWYLVMLSDLLLCLYCLQYCIYLI